MYKILMLPLVALAFTLSACAEKASTTSEVAKPAEQAAQATTPNAPPQATEQVAGNAVHPGKAIHDANCISCHDSGVYTRANHKMKDLTMLAGQVRRCDANLGTKLFDEDLDNVTAFLNETYYKFPK